MGRIGPCRAGARNWDPRDYAQIRIVGVVGRDCRRQCRDQQDARHHDRADKAKRLATGKAQAPQQGATAGPLRPPPLPGWRATTFAVIS